MNNCLFSRKKWFSLALLLFFSFAAMVASAQKYKLNQRIELNVDNKGVWYKGYVKEVQTSSDGTFVYLVHLDKGVESYGGGTEFTVSPRYYGMMHPEGEAANPNPANCQFGPPPGTFTGASPASLPLFKRVLYNRLNLLATGVGGYPARIGVSFLVFDVAKAYKNTVSVVPGRGAQRINDAAPPDATIYPATIKYILCEDYNPGIMRKMVESKWEFFVDRFGEWTASKTNLFDTTTPLND